MTHHESSYGYYLGGDPRKFTPDEEMSTPGEIEAWKRACEAWGRGEKPDPGGPHIPLENGDGVCVGHLTLAHYGLGVTEFEGECTGADCSWCEGLW